MIQINPSGQALVIYLDQKMHSSLVINALGLNRPWASSLFYIEYAFQKAKNYDNLWEVHIRRGILIQIMDQWTMLLSDNANVEILLEALSVPGFMDVKLRVEKLLEQNI